MSSKYPMEFTLEDGVHVIVSQVNDHLYDFALVKSNGEESHFTYDEAVEKDERWEQTLSFDQLNAVRRFWLEQE